VPVTARILVVDNYDSFVYNLVQYLAQLGAECVVRRNDDVDLATVGEYAGVLLSPGPGTPDDAGVCLALLERWGSQVPILGVCLGHQAIGQVYGGRVSRAPELRHGKTSLVHHRGEGVLAGLPTPFTATRYHSLAVEPDSVPASLVVTAWTDDDVIMGLRHGTDRVEGVQFHPESVLTEGGHHLLANWLVTCGETDAPRRAVGLTPVVTS
jgi:para-aminobenzoate synthetase component 2